MDQFASDMVLTASNQYQEHEEGYMKDTLSGKLIQFKWHTVDINSSYSE